MNVVVDTGVFSAARVRRPPSRFEPYIRRLVGNSLFLAAVTVAELRYGALAARWGTPRRARLEADIATTTVVPVTDALITGVAALRSDCRDAGHPLHDKVHANDLWIAASAIRIGAPIITADRIFDGVPGLEVITM